MELILHLETSTKVCSVTLSKGSDIVALEEIEEEKYSHAENLTIFIEKVFEKTDFSKNDLNAVALSAGPGSYTGLRIGCSTAKGLCYGLDIPLIAVDSLQSLAALVKNDTDLICPMFDARRMEVYSAIYNAKLSEIEAVSPKILDEYRYEDHLSDNTVCFLGPGAIKASKIIDHPNAVFDLETNVSSSGMVKLALKKYHQKDFVDTAYFEPNYLKEFIVGKPKKGL